jgi:hypothetical protein
MSVLVESAKMKLGGYFIIKSSMDRALPRFDADFHIADFQITDHQNVNFYIADSQNVKIFNTLFMLLAPAWKFTTGFRSSHCSIE